MIQDKPVLIVFSYHLAINLYLRIFFWDRQERVDENEKDKGKQNRKRKIDLRGLEEVKYDMQEKLLRQKDW
jgi:hypothetical protein